MAVSSFSYVSSLIASWSLPKCQNPGQDLAQNWRFQSFLCQRFNNQLRQLGPAQTQRSFPVFLMSACRNVKIQLQKAPGQYSAQNGRFLFFPQQSDSQVELAQMPKSSSKTLQARIWPKMPVSILSYVSGLIASRVLSKCKNPAPRGSLPPLLAATVTEAETYQLWCTTGTSPSWRL